MMRDPLVLAPGLTLQPTHDLPEPLQRTLNAQPGDHALFRPGGRGFDKVISADAAALLRRFEVPRAPIAAIAAHARETGIDAELLVEQAWPLLVALTQEGLLREPSAPAPETKIVIKPGADGPRWTDAVLVREMEDSAVFRASLEDGARVALKVARVRHPAVLSALAREAAVLRHLDGQVAPLLHHAGATEAGDPLLVMRWSEGVPLAQATANARQAGDHGALLDAVRALARAYATLHEAGVLHGDVHPGNLLVGRDGAVTLIDFGFGVLTAEGAAAPRAGVLQYFDPDMAQHHLDGRAAPPANPAAEQYAVAALAWETVTGFPPFDLPVEREAALRRLAQGGPTSFAVRGVPAWPAMEAVLVRALSADAAARFPDLATMLAALAAVEAPPAALRRPSTAIDDAARRLDRLLRAADLRFEAGAPCSLAHGAAGAPWALYRLACATDRPELLARAVTWTRAIQDRAERQGAFIDPADKAQTDPGGSPWHSPAGVAWLTAVIGSASGDPELLRAGVRRYAREADRPGPAEVACGASGALLGAASLLELVRGRAAEEEATLHAVGAALQDRLTATVRRWSTDPYDTPMLGMAHGRAGVLAASLRWAEASGCEADPALVAALHEHAEVGISAGRGLAWPADLRAPATPPPAGWCHGLAGQTLLWTIAHRVTGQPRFLELADRAAWSVWDHAGGPNQVCCGRCGQAWALHRVAEATGDARWSARARAVSAVEGGDSPEYPDSVYKGRLGPAVLEAELEHTGRTAFPFVEGEP